VVYAGMNRYEQGRQAFERARELIEHRYGAMHPDLSTVLANGAELYCRMHRFEQAKALAESAWKLDQATRGPKSLFVARDLKTYAAAQRGMNRKAEARKHEALARSLLKEAKN
jgi:hypothetical protein